MPKMKFRNLNNNISRDCYDMFPNLTTIINEVLHIDEYILPKKLLNLIELYEISSFIKWMPSFVKEDPLIRNSCTQNPFISSKDNLN